MKRQAAMLMIVITGMMAPGPLSPVTAQEYPAGAVSASPEHILLPPRVDRIAVRATFLHWGMSGVDVEQIMGGPADLQAYDGPSGNARVLAYPAEPIATKVSICDGKVCAVRLDVAGVNDRALPPYSRPVWLGMDRASVLRILGAPAESRLCDCHGMKLEHWIFERPGQPAVGVVLIDGRVAAKRVGNELPSDILTFTLPMSDDPANEETDAQADGRAERQVRVGMMRNDVEALFGTPKLLVASAFKGRPVHYAIYQTNPDGSFGSFTFIDGVLTEFAGGGTTPLGNILSGG